MTADEDSTPDLQVLLDGIDSELRDLVELAGGPPAVIDLTQRESLTRA